MDGQLDGHPGRGCVTGCSEVSWSLAKGGSRTRLPTGLESAPPPQTDRTLRDEPKCRAHRNALVPPEAAHPTVRAAPPIDS